MPFRSTKTFTPEMGLSACFRQWRADSHCRFLHGYALGIKLTFESDELDVRNWVVDFGSLKSFKTLLENTFDHKLVVAEDDPELETLQMLHDKGIAEIVIVPAGGCERFAEMVYEVAEIWLRDAGYAPRVRIVSAEVFEHGANSAIFYKDKP